MVKVWPVGCVTESPDPEMGPAKGQNDSSARGDVCVEKSRGGPLGWREPCRGPSKKPVPPSRGEKPEARG